MPQTRYNMKAKMDIKKLKQLSLNDKALVDNALDFAAEIARTAHRRLSSWPSAKDVSECIDIVDDHLGFVPSGDEVEAFLLLHPELKSLVMEFGATDTEVRSEVLAAVFHFTLRTTDFVEGDTEINNLVAQQWKRIWA